MQAKADEALREARYKDAIDHYKFLLKQEPNPDWLSRLAQAYAGRARQLAAKGMLKEALAVWRMRAEVCALPLELGSCLSWLIRLGEWEQVFGILHGADPLPDDQREEAQTQLARAALTAPADVLLKFPSDSPLLLHRSAALAALAACAEGDAGAMNEHLSHIPFRSPYRDLRAVLKALTLFPVDVGQAGEVIGRVPAGGVFEPLAAALRICVLPGDTWLASLSKLDKHTRGLVFDIKGCPPEQRAAVTELSLLEEDPAALYGLVARHRQAFPPGLAARLCLRLLVHVPGRIKTYGTNFAPLPATEQARILALGAELKGRPDEAEAHWRRMIDTMTAGQNARVALILNRMADGHHHGGQPGELCEHGIELLERSLDIDAADRGTHLRLIRALKIAGTEPGALRKRLDGAVDQFPRDLEILLQAMEAALESGAFEQTQDLAKRALQLDPINPKVRSALGQAHLSQARLQIAAGDLDSARRKLEQAGSLLRGEGLGGGAARGAHEILLGLAAQSPDDTAALLRAAVAKLGAGLAGIFHLLLEAAHTKRNPLELLGLAGAGLEATPSIGEMVGFAHALDAARESDPFLRGVLAPLEKMILRAAILPFEESDYALVCGALERRGARSLAGRYAEAALKRWPGRPVFVYLRAAALYAGTTTRIPDKEYTALEKAFDAAESQGDKRTASRLDALLEEGTSDFAMPARPTGMPGLHDLAPPDMVAEMEEMIALGGGSAFLDAVRKQIGKRAFEQMRREIGGSKKEFARHVVQMFTEAQDFLGAGDTPYRDEARADISVPPTPSGTLVPRIPARASSPHNPKGPPSPGIPTGAPTPSTQRPAPPGQKDLFDE